MLTIFDDLNPFRRGRRYRYAVLSYVPSLADRSEVTPVAVVVESKDGDRVRFNVVGIYPDSTFASRLGTRILEQLPHWVLNQIREAVDTGTDPLAYLAGQTPYNLRFSMPEPYRSTKELEAAAMDLFQVEVLGILPRDATRRPSVPVTGPVRDFFQSEVPGGHHSFAG